ncbi:hypothetical protein HAP47_0020645 [Bradyrhizobium sp. 41S5]|uniref:hypothetical protein n=1 Tax=Bradyrhizobium sp. 41S5 TaxID=1404443 RepID=UPI00156AB33E|nr:hypothetical protein [Bradyrhizobium sp. 41S5]UFX41723.1 hypothetical protein HAP47_0020645 [Bradyrhizobium sp. 41S5]
MSTLNKLVQAGTLTSVTLGLLDDELPERGLFGTTRLHNFLANDLPSIPSRDATLSALEQVANLFGRFLTNKPLVLQSPIAPVRHLEDSVWELKTKDVRIFGWFAAKDSMVIDAGCDVKLLKAGKINYSAFINQTSYVRKALGFSTNDYIIGKLPHDILTRIVIPPRR